MSDRPITYPKGTIKYLGTEARGANFVIGPDLPLLRFGDAPGTNKRIRKFHMDKPEEKAMFEAVIESKPYKNGQIIYVESPEEIKAKAKKIKQGETLKTIKEALDTGIMSVTDMNRMESPDLLKLADSIGAECMYYNKASDKYQSLRKEVLIKNIRLLLGIAMNAKEKQKEESPVN